MAAAIDLPALVAEEPATILMTGLVTAGDWIEAYRSSRERADFKDKIARIGSPIFIVQSDEQSTLNRFTAEVLVPELRAAGNAVDVRSYEGPYGSRGGHGFAHRSRTAAALRAFDDIDAFFRRHLGTQPSAIEDPAAVEQISASAPRQRQAIELSPEIFADYVGVYELPSNISEVAPPSVPRTFTMTLEDGQLMLETFLGKTRLFPESETYFFIPEGPAVEFVRDEQCMVTGLMLPSMWVPKQ